MWPGEGEEDEGLGDPDLELLQSGRHGIDAVLQQFKAWSVHDADDADDAVWRGEAEPAKVRACSLFEV